MSRTRALLLTLFTSLTFWLTRAGAQDLTPVPPPSTEPSAAEQARAHFTRGNELYATGDVRGTLVEFERAYALRPSPLLCFHIAQVALELRQLARSYRGFAQFLTTSENDTSDAGLVERRLEAQRRLMELEPEVSHLTVEVNVPGAHLSIDEQSVGESPFSEAFVLDPGVIQLRLSKLGYETHVRQVPLVAGERTTLSIALAERTLPAPALPSVQVPPVAAVPRLSAVAPPPRLMTPGLWVGFGAAAALGVAGGITGLLALRASSDLEQTHFVGSAARRDFDRESQRARLLAISTDVLLASGLVAAQVSLGVLLWRRSDLRSARSQVRAQVGSSGLSLSGQF